MPPSFPSQSTIVPAAAPTPAANGAAGAGENTSAWWSPWCARSTMKRSHICARFQSRRREGDPVAFSLR